MIDHDCITPCVMIVSKLHYDLCHDCVMTPYRSVINCIMAGHGRTFFIGCIFFFRAVMRVVNNKTPSWKGIFLRRYSTFFLKSIFLKRYPILFMKKYSPEKIFKLLQEKVFSWKSNDLSSWKSILLKKSSNLLQEKVFPWKSIHLFSWKSIHPSS